MAKAETIGIRIKAKRLREGLTQDELGAKLGLTQAAVSHWERGATVPSALARAIVKEIPQEITEEVRDQASKVWVNWRTSIHIRTVTYQLTPEFMCFTKKCDWRNK